MSGHLVFGYVIILNASVISDWVAVRRNKQELIEKNKQNKILT